jgi:hypothetical protein
MLRAKEMRKGGCSMAARGDEPAGARIRTTIPWTLIAGWKNDVKTLGRALAVEEEDTDELKIARIVSS